MKRLFLIIAIFLLSVSISFAALPFTKDIIVTSPDGIWTDTRAYTTLNLAIAACGTDIRTIVIPTDQTVTTLTVPVTITLRFERDGSITNSGQLTINTSKIEADSHQIFTGTGDIDFLAGTTVKTSWFADLDEALDVTSDDTVTILISAAETTDADMAVGNNVTLRWESPFIITVDTGDTVSNIKNIEAGDYQIFSGAGDFDFLDGTELKSFWFNRLRSATAWIEAEEVTILINETLTLDLDLTTTANEAIEVLQGGTLDYNGNTLTINGPFKGSNDCFLDTAGGGTLVLNISPVYVSWFGEGTTAIEDAAAAIQSKAELIFDPTVIYALDGTVNFTVQCTLTGNGAIIQTVDTYVDGFYVTGDKTIINDLTFEPSGVITRYRSCLKINADDCKVTDCRFLGNGEVVGEYGRGTGLVFGSGITNPDNLTIDRCYFKDFEAMINITTSTDVTITNSYFTGGVDPTYAGANYGGSYMGDAIKVNTPSPYARNQGADIFDDDYSAGTYITVTNNKFINVNRDALDAFQGGTNIIFSDNIVSGSRMDTCLDIKVFYPAAAGGTGVSIPTHRQSRNVTITNNQFIDAICYNWTINLSSNLTDPLGVPVAALDDDNVIYSIIISGNNFDGPKNPVLNINNSSGVSFTDNIVRGYAAGSNDEFVIIMKSLQLSAPTMKRFNFSDNQINITDSGVNLGFIRLFEDIDTDVGEGAAAVVESMVVSDNVFYCGDDDKFFDMGAVSQIADLQITGNIMKGPSSTPWANTFLHLRDVTNANIVNNQMSYCEIEAINIVGAEFMNITGNIIREAGQSTSDRDIRIDDGTAVASSDYIFIHDNILQDNAGSIPGFTNNTSGTIVIVTEQGREATTAQLGDVTHAINTASSKVAGFQILNTDTGRYVYAVGNADDSVWNYGWGVLAHVPS